MKSISRYTHRILVTMIAMVNTTTAMRICSGFLHNLWTCDPSWLLSGQILAQAHCPATMWAKH